MSDDLYQEIILEEYSHPHHFGKLEQPDIEWKERNSSCGDEITIFLKLDDSKEKILEMSWEGQGCAISLAATSLLSQYVPQKTVKSILNMKKHDVEELLGIDEIAYGRQKCLLLSLKAIQKSLTQKATHDE